MATYSKQLLSASTNGQPVKVAATSTPGTLIHTAVAGTAAFDEIWLWVTNTDTASRNLTIEYGGATSPDDHICDTVPIPPNSAPVLVCMGFLLQNGLTVKAFADVANKLIITGFVNRIS